MDLIDLGTEDFNTRFYDVIEMLARQVNVDLPSEEDLWSAMREHVEIPNASAIFLKLATSKVELAFKEKYPNIKFYSYLSGSDSYISLNGEPIDGYADLERVLSSEDDDGGYPSETQMNAIRRMVPQEPSTLKIISTLFKR